MRTQYGKYTSTLLFLAVGVWFSLPVWAAEAEFAVGQNMFLAEPQERPRLPGYKIQNIMQLPPLTLSQLTSRLRGEIIFSSGGVEVSPKVEVAAKHLTKAPLIFVVGPKTAGKLTAVELSDKRGESRSEDAETLREAEASLQVDLPPLDRTKNRPPPAQSWKTTLLSPTLPSATQLKLQDHAGQLAISPKALLLSLQDPGVIVDDKGLPGPVQIFLRHPKTVQWNAKSHRLLALAKGHTELYISYRDQLYIVPIEVQNSKERDPLLSDIRGNFQKLTSIMPMIEHPYANFEGASPSEELNSIVPVPEAVPMPNKQRSPLTLASTSAEVDVTAANAADQLARYSYTDPSPKYKTVGIQVIDERSAPEQQQIFPVSGVTVRLLGTLLAAKTDAKGIALFGEIPEGARFIAQIEDEKGRVVAGATELSFPLGARDQVLRARTLNYRSYFAYLNIIDRAQDTARGSLCARAMTEDGSKAIEGLQVKLNAEADGPYYIGPFGPHRDLKSTDRSGKFCFFNISPGLVELSFSRDGQYQTALALPIFPGAHSEEDLALQSDLGGRLFLAALPSAVDQIYEEKQAIDQPFQAVDYVDMLAVGENTKMVKIADSVLAYEPGNSLFKGRLYGLVQSPEFETSLHSLDSDQEIKNSLRVVPLLQRGFVEDVFHELAVQDGNASIAFDPSLGSAFILHRLSNGQDQLRISLVDTLGQIYDQGWSFGSANQGLAHTVFFNLQPGIYQVKVENRLGALIALNTFAIDYWTNTVVQTGSSLHYNLQSKKSRDDD